MTVPSQSGTSCWFSGWRSAARCSKRFFNAGGICCATDSWAGSEVHLPRPPGRGGSCREERSSSAPPASWWSVQTPLCDRGLCASEALLCSALRSLARCSRRLLSASGIWLATDGSWSPRPMSTTMTPAFSCAAGFGGRPTAFRAPRRGLPKTRGSLHASSSSAEPRSPLDQMSPSAASGSGARSARGSLMALGGRFRGGGSWGAWSEASELILRRSCAAIRFEGGR
mmetsp:Transcript_112605/g.318073  ORF Transcript_112605/g.318073 Transcript_112605/m.318073 type:complete len:227 (-) Transcript_112605:268-948(-)